MPQNVRESVAAHHHMPGLELNSTVWDYLERKKKITKDLFKFQMSVKECDNFKYDQNLYI